MPPRRHDFFTFLASRSAEVIDPSSLKRKLVTRRKLRVKLGIDPTAPDLHLGHLVPLRMLRAFQDAGHQAVLIIGDFTGQIVDPSEQSSARRQLSAAAVKANERTYLGQAGRILNLKRTEVRHNSQWFGRMRLSEFLGLLARFSLKSASERADFQKRIRTGRDVRLHEATYHVLQAYDSVAVRADVEIGSLDQKLNILAGRELQAKLGQAPQSVVLVPYLIGLDGKAKMAKSVGNTINLRDSAKDMFGKVMSIPDALIINYAELAAWLPSGEVRGITRRLERGENPRDLKLEVATAVTALYHGHKAARRVGDEFLRTFGRSAFPARAPLRRVASGLRPVDFVMALKGTSSHGEARRLIAGGAVEVDGRRLTLREPGVTLRPGSRVRVGKKQFYRIRQER